MIVRDEFLIDQASGAIYEHGWQSWSPSTTYTLGDQPWRSTSERTRILCYRPERSPSADVFWGEGLLAIDPGDETGIRIYAVREAIETVPSIKAEARGNQMVVSSDGAIDCLTDRGPGGIEGALARWAEGFALRAGVTSLRRAPTIWCSWYHYFNDVTDADMMENLAAINDLDLPIDVIQLDDGYQAEIGDWLILSDRFASVEAMSGRIREAGQRTGIWVAPFVVGSQSQLAAAHPEWLVQGSGGPANAGHNWDQDLYALDTTHPGAQEYLHKVFSTMYRWGIDFYKIDFIYGAAIPGKRYADVAPISAYRTGVELVRRAIGDSYLLACGAPILPTVGLVDAMRVSPDTAPHYQPLENDMSQPGSRAAILTGVGRAFQHGRFWVNDPDNLVVRPTAEHREEWANHIRHYGGLRGSSDRIADLDGWGLAVTRELLSGSSVEPFIPSA